ncbi:hypothetical protein MGG_10561 [Pyricularia oryzae 70-15]|uniref:Tyrosinase copper-binding domain-containing protein n=3 Tax=Pyricularia oryzae TaxID=318829 RepID=G5EHG8_PYRO7|nr:uncharacterized protein MGG_10561 [Pyricularia oryzae 70-15]ELQ40870.1 hypothetical protein OOU_Y34scaffold00327g3 [Pyricularia oryzae Y34]KAI7909604.1 hypothetical protein M9X92_011541 [Pyricularia oryzae]EAQ70702.1 hypothetical protein MGCH7_ch7g109 [Pyricularia oryzae 70-15]EHA46650.1 hypothetical protein MGG_10561 [Pyricularia oryzae 70-15]KAI7909710.1 hypothetical protein M0657_011722 [Pyricularia oryzae]
MARLFSTALLALGLVGGMAAAQGSQPDALKQLENKGMPQLMAQLAKSKTCSNATMRIRKEWGDLPGAERKEYIAAVLCLSQRPSHYSPSVCPGCKSRYDDFVAVHMEFTPTIHGTGNFLSWHRHYTYAFESALIKECGYTGAQPYWDYGRWAQDPLNSPIFDGSDTSMSGNGEKIPHRSTLSPAGEGGGCLVSGPFKNMTVYLGPLAATADPRPKANPQANGLGSNPRCIQRDVTNYLSSRYGRTQDIVNLITRNSAIGPFQTAMQSTTGSAIGIHGVGHFVHGSQDPGGDFYISPNDPVFWLHHSMIDRVWTIWQSQDLANRLMVIAGGTSMFGIGSRLQSLDDLIDLGNVEPTAKKWKIRELVSIVDGPLCYMYQ